MRHHDLIERMLPPTAAILCAVLAALAVWAATAGAAAAGRPAAANAFSGPIEAPPRAIERVLGPESRAGLRRVACVGEPAAVASCYVATR